MITKDEIEAKAEEFVIHHASHGRLAIQRECEAVLQMPNKFSNFEPRKVERVPGRVCGKEVRLPRLPPIPLELASASHAAGSLRGFGPHTSARPRFVAQ